MRLFIIVLVVLLTITSNAIALNVRDTSLIRIAFQNGMNTILQLEISDIERMKGNYNNMIITCNTLTNKYMSTVNNLNR